jgi:hypothetical protein
LWCNGRVGRERASFAEGRQGAALGLQADFFVARHSSALEVMGLVLALFLLSPALLWGLERAMGLVATRLEGALHRVFVAVLVALTVLPPLVRAELPAPATLSLAAALGFAAGLLQPPRRAEPGAAQRRRGPRRHPRRTSGADRARDFRRASHDVAARRERRHRPGPPPELRTARAWVVVAAARLEH